MEDPPEEVRSLSLSVRKLLATADLEAMKRRIGELHKKAKVLLGALPVRRRRKIVAVSCPSHVTCVLTHVCCSLGEDVFEKVRSYIWDSMNAEHDGNGQDTQGSFLVRSPPRSRLPSSSSFLYAACPSFLLTPRLRSSSLHFSSCRRPSSLTPLGTGALAPKGPLVSQPEREAPWCCLARLRDGPSPALGVTGHGRRREHGTSAARPEDCQARGSLRRGHGSKQVGG